MNKMSTLIKDVYGMKEFSHVPLSTQLPEVSTQTIKGKRFYVTPEGKKYPSITTVLSGRNSEGLVRVDMGLPDIRTSINRHGVNYDHVLIGNPHAVINLAGNNISEENYQNIALDIQGTWEDGINVGFMSIIDRDSIQLKVFERGSGFTKACGSGACAAAAVAISKNKLKAPITVNMDGGVVQIDWDMKNTITLSGSAEISFEGEVNLNAYA